MRNAFVKVLGELAAHDSRLFLITGDLGFGVFEPFEEAFPGQFLNAGVAEQNMTAIAAGMALEGHVVFTYSIGNFPTLRCLEQIRNDVCYHDAPVKIVCVGGGFSYGALGMSHHATEDIAIMRALPNMTVLAPGTRWETSQLVPAIVAHPGPCYLRLERAGVDAIPGEDVEPFVMGRARMLREGQDVTLIATGGILAETLAAAEDLAAAGISARVLSMHSIKPLDIDAIGAAVRETGGIVTVEEHNRLGGLGGAVAEVCLEAGWTPRRFLRIGLDDTYSSVVGSQDFLRRHYEMDRLSIARRTRVLLAGP